MGVGMTWDAVIVAPRWELPPEPPPDPAIARAEAVPEPDGEAGPTA